MINDTGFNCYIILSLLKPMITRQFSVRTFRLLHDYSLKAMIWLCWLFVMIGLFWLKVNGTLFHYIRFEYTVIQTKHINLKL